MERKTVDLNTNESDSYSMVVCICKNVTCGQIQDCIKTENVTDIDSLCQKLPIAQVCGKCLLTACEMLHETKQELTESQQ